MIDDFSKLKAMKYSGRGITIGMTLEGSPFVGYTLTGRSPSSQARKLVYDESLSTIMTDVTDPEQLKKGNPALLIYPAIVAVEKRRIIASNGVQTKLLANSAIRMYKKDIYPTDILIDAMNMPVNENGIDITSVSSLEPHAIFYDWHVHEAFNETPNEIYVPYGSGRVMENYVTWQMRNARKKDPRLKIPVGRLINISILGAEPEKRKSIADKLTKDYNPFVIFHDEDLSALRTLAFTGRNTGVYQIPEERIEQAYKLLRKYCDTEPSGSAGLALYLQRFDEGKISPRNKVLIVNTGKGI